MCKNGYNCDKNFGFCICKFLELDCNFLNYKFELKLSGNFFFDIIFFWLDKNFIKLSIIKF